MFDLLNTKNPYGRGCNTPLKSTTENFWREILNDGIKYLQQLKTKNRNIYIPPHTEHP